MLAVYISGAGLVSKAKSFFVNSFFVCIALITLAIALDAPACADAPGSNVRVALLVANGNYPDANLPSQSAAKDADLLAGELTRYGFSVDSRRDLSRQDMLAAIDSLYGKIVPGSTALLYFNGIGIQAAHQTFLIPVNAQVWSEGDVKREGISVDDVLAEIARRGARIKIVILDASRRNPFERRFRAYSAGLAGIDAPEGSLVVYAAAPNRVMQDSTGGVSLFMNELVKELRTPDISAEEAMTQTRIGVSRASNGEEVPWVASSIAEPFYFGRAPSQATTSGKSTRDKPVVPIKVPETTTPPVTIPPVTVPPVIPPQQIDPPRKDPDKQVSIPVQKVPKEPIPPKAAAGVFRDCPDCPDMIMLPGASFRMGSGTTPFDKPVHIVTIARPFALGVTPVTLADWNQCASDGGCKYHPDAQGGSTDRPVTNLAWSDAHEYATWLSKKTGKSYRLPSESEWEYAARAGTTTPFYWGSTVGSDNANCLDCGGATGKQTMPVKSFKPNGFGLYDMAGNAAEWVEDCWNSSYRGAPADGAAWSKGSCEQRVLRGGSFDSSSAYIKPAARFRYDADVRYYANGFRLARDGG